MRRVVFLAQGRRCAQCGETKGELHVHHLTYERFGNESLQDLQVLCKTCHLGHHEMRGLEQPKPTKKKRPKGHHRKKIVGYYKPAKKQVSGKKRRLTQDNEALHALQVANRRRREAREWGSTST